MSDLKGKVIIVTGAAMGLGFAAADVLAAKGAHITLVDYNSEALEKAKSELSAKHIDSEFLVVTADVSVEENVKNYVDQTVQKFGKVDGLYNNAGIEGKQAPLIDYDIEVFKKVIDINLLGVYYGMKYVIPEMQKNGCGRIVNVASVGGIRGVLNQTAYVATKHAVAGMTKNAAL
ncbi:MAG: SDR family NAD(P)-dependent oxidoreductase, partial [Myroides sp.]